MEDGQDTDGSTPGNAYSDFPDGSLYLEILSPSNTLVSSSAASLNLHGVQNGHVYEIMSTLDVSNAIPQAWNIEQSLHAATNQDPIPFTVPVLDRTNRLFFRAKDWTTLDANSNGIPDWWEWENFGDFNQPTNADFDGDHVSNLAEYLAGTDPNTILFLASPIRKYVNSSVAGLLVNVVGGVPSSAAVLVDSTNFASANWTKYSSNFSANVGLTEGWHQIWVGLRGRKTTSEQTWRSTRVKLDLTAPAIFITNPASAVVSQPVVQIQGYCLEALASISYDIFNLARAY
jgi:hypothetical protein